MTPWLSLAALRPALDGASPGDCAFIYSSSDRIFPSLVCGHREAIEALLKRRCDVATQFRKLLLISFRCDDYRGNIAARLTGMESQAWLTEQGTTCRAGVCLIFVPPKPPVVVRQKFWTLMTYKPTPRRRSQPATKVR